MESRKAHLHLTLAELEQAATGRLSESAERHLSTCAECADMVAARALLARPEAWEDPMELHAWGATPECLPLDRLSQAGAGQAANLDPDELDHVAGCRRCSLFLRAAAGDPQFRPNATHPEEARVQTLASRLHNQQPPSISRPDAIPAGATVNRPRLSWEHRSGWIAAAAVLVALIGGVLWQQSMRPSPEALLATAYTKSRPYEYRLPDAGYATVRQPRSAGQSVLARPEELIEAEKLINEELKLAPDTPRNMWLVGSEELLEGLYDPAIGALTRAADGDPENAEAHMALGVAYALRGDTENRALDHARAADALLAARRLDPSNAITIFNLALVYTRMGLYEQALETWDEFLALDSEDRWAEEARERREALREDMQEYDSIGKRIQADPSAFLNWAREDAADIHAEWFQDIAWERWLPAAAEDAQAEQALRVLANMFAERHGDTSLRDALAAALRNPAGLAELSDAVMRANQGDYAGAHAAAQQAEALLIENPAAVFRARLIEAEGRHQGEAEKCIAIMQPLLRDLRRTPYVWMHASADLQEALCAARSESGGSGIAEIREAGRLAHEAGFVGLAFRAEALATNRVRGDVSEAWDQGLAGMRQAWNSHARGSARQLFLRVLAASAVRQNFTDLAPVLQQILVRRLTERGAPQQVEGLNRALAAAALERAGDHEAAGEQVRKVDSIFATLGNTPNISNFRYVSKLVEVKYGTLPARERVLALRVLEQQWTSASWVEKLEVETELGNALRETGDVEAAAVAYEKALELYAYRLRDVQDDPLEEVATREAALPLVKKVIEIAVQTDPSHALELWDEYRPRGALSDYPARSQEAALVYIPLQTSLVVFTVREEKVQGHLVPADVEELSHVAQRLRRFCASADTPLADIRRDARTLYDRLIAPYEEEIGDARVLAIDAGGWVSSLPFAVLTDPNGRYLAQKFTLFRGVRNGEALAELGPLDDGLVLSAPSPGGRDASRFPALPAAGRETRRVADYFSHVQVLADRKLTLKSLTEAVPSARYLHFAGHGWSNGGDGGLVLPAASPSDEPVFVTALELERLDWSRYALVVLSACLSGTGEGVGPASRHSLVRAFLAGGARRVVASLWDADSEAAARLMDHFYMSLEDGNDAATALTQARRELMTEGKWSHPYYWAPFTLYSY